MSCVGALEPSIEAVAHARALIGSSVRPPQGVLEALLGVVVDFKFPGRGVADIHPPEASRAVGRIGRGGFTGNPPKKSTARACFNLCFKRSLLKVSNNYYLLLTYYL